MGISENQCITCQEAGRICDQVSAVCTNCKVYGEITCRWAGNEVIALDDRTFTNVDDGLPPALSASEVVKVAWKNIFCKTYLEHDEEFLSLFFRVSSKAPDGLLYAIDAVLSFILELNHTKSRCSPIETQNAASKRLRDTFSVIDQSQSLRFCAITTAVINISQRFHALPSSPFPYLSLLCNFVGRATLICGRDSEALPCVIIKSCIYHLALTSFFAFPEALHISDDINYLEGLQNRLEPTSATHYCHRQDSFHRVPLILLRYIYEICCIRSRYYGCLQLEQGDNDKLLDIKNRIQESLTSNSQLSGVHGGQMAELYRRTSLLLIEKRLNPNLTCQEARLLFFDCLDALNAFQNQKNAAPAIIWPIIVVFFATMPEDREYFRSYFRWFNVFATKQKAELLTNALEQIAIRGSSSSTTPDENTMFNMLLHSDFEDLRQYVIV